ncbi:helix-turn-helix domain-containing protein [Brotaphodocola sp.]|uniref:helix-turn-helix domain-containing protein n=1 Tax=Brotaphodocola sp. TaxID=3073577 RepID=UPI003D7EEE0F
MASFNEILKQLRNRDNLSQAELAQKLGVAKSTIGMYESGKREPDFETLESIADFFNVDMNFLLGRDGSENDHYYLNDETRQIAQEAFENPELRTLFHVARDIPPERLKAHIEFMKSLKRQEKGEYDDGC